MILFVLSVRVLLVNVSVVLRAMMVSVDVGRLRMPVLEIDEMIGVVRALLVSVCEAVKVVMVSLISGKVMVRFVVCIEAKVRVVEVVAENVEKLILLEGSVLSM